MICCMVPLLGQCPNFRTLFLDGFPQSLYVCTAMLGPIQVDAQQRLQINQYIIFSTTNLNRNATWLLSRLYHHITQKWMKIEELDFAGKYISEAKHTEQGRLKNSTQNQAQLMFSFRIKYHINQFCGVSTVRFIAVLFQKSARTKAPRTFITHISQVSIIIICQFLMFFIVTVSCKLLQTMVTLNVV